MFKSKVVLVLIESFRKDKNEAALYKLGPWT